MDVNSSSEASLSLNAASASASASRPHNLRRIHCPASRPQSRSYFLSSCVSSRNRMPTASPNRTTAVQNRLGRRYGYVSKMVPVNTVGHCWTGRARTPPRNPPMMVLQKSGQIACKNVVLRGNVPKTPNKGHDGISARYRALGFDRQRLDITANLRWCFSTVTNSATVVWSTPMFLHTRLAAAHTLNGAMTSPIEQTSECPSDQCHWQTLREAKKYHAQPCAEQASEQHLFPPDTIT